MEKSIFDIMRDLSPNERRERERKKRGENKKEGGIVFMFNKVGMTQ